MPFDIYGAPLRRGHCEVHPNVHEEYPCSLCLAERDRREDEEAKHMRALLRHEVTPARSCGALHDLNPLIFRPPAGYRLQPISEFDAYEAQRLRATALETVLKAAVDSFAYAPGKGPQWWNDAKRLLGEL